MKWIGQHIWDFISRFRTTVYLENLETSSDENVLVVDSDGKVTKNTTLGGDDLSFDGSTASGVLTYKDADEIKVESTLTYDASGLGSLKLIHGGLAHIYVEQTTDNVTGPMISFANYRGGGNDGEDGDTCGSVRFYGNDDDTTPNNTLYAII